MKNFKDKVAVITGAASGIGRGLAERCKKEGMKIVLADVEEEPLVIAETELKTTGGMACAVVADVSKISDVQRLVQQALDCYGKIDILFNNAGVAAGSSIWESTLNDCKWVVDVNLWGAIHCIREVVPIMLKQDTACHIVNTSSITGLSTYHPSALYHLTKHGIVALSEQLHHDLAIRGSNIKVSVLCPGFVNTRIMDAERNRPDVYVNDLSDAEPDPALVEMFGFFRRLIQEGMSPLAVADCVFRAIEAEKFFIFTHPEMNGLIHSRMEDIVQARNPTLPPMDGP